MSKDISGATKVAVKMMNKREGQEKAKTIAKEKSPSDSKPTAKKSIAKKMARTATAADRKKDPYLSADSKVYPKK